MIHTNRTAQRTWCHAVWLLAVFWLIAGIPSLAQSGRGTLTGSVKDASGASIFGASLTLKETNTGSRYTTIASDEGLFTFPELPPGTYTLAITSQGFESYTQVGITVNVGSTATINAVLKIGSATESVTVTSDASQLQTESSDIGTTVSSALIEDLPPQYAGAPRNPLQFVELAPGYSGLNSNSPTQNSDVFKLNGGQEASMDIFVDGATIELVSPSMQMNYGVSVEAVQEFKVMTNTFDAQYGRMGGGLINLVTKSGSNSLHGDAYDILRNKSLDANSWISNLQKQPRGLDTQNDFGALISGPVYIPKLYNGRDKTFFMFNYEGFRFHTGGNGLNGAPTQAMTTGDFSSLLTPVTVFGTTFPAHILYDYTTCTYANQGKACVPYGATADAASPTGWSGTPTNIIPSTAEDSVFKAAIPDMPQAPSGVTSPYQNTPVSSLDITNANMYEIRIDQNIGAKQKINGSYDYDWRPTEDTIAGHPLDTSATNQRTHYVRFGYDYIFSPNLLNHFNAGYSRRYRVEGSGIGSYGGNWPDKLGLKGVMQTTFPYFDYNYHNGAPVPSNGADAFVDNTYQYDDNLSWQHGRHSLKFGVEARLQEFNINVATQTSGEFTFGSGPTSTGNLSDPNQANSGFNYASFFLGAGSPNGDGNHNRIVLPQQLGWRVKYYAGFVQDDWKVNPKLTVNAGFRYEIPTPVTEAHGQQSFMNPTLANPAAGNLPGAYEFLGTGTGRTGSDSYQDTFKKSYGPRIGLAYQVRPDTVVRAGYGIYYQSLKIGGFGENDSAGFTGSYQYPTGANQQTPEVLLDKITAYPGTLPPFVGPSSMNGQAPTVIISKTGRPGTTQTWTLDVEQQLPGKFVVDMAYVGDHGDHLPAFMHDPNQGLPVNQVRGACLNVDITAQAGNAACTGQTPVTAPYAGFSGTVSQALRPFPQYGNADVDTVTMGDPAGVYTYHALQVTAKKSISAGLTLLASYAWQKTLTNSDSEYPAVASWFANGNGGALNTYNLKVEKGLSQYDVPQRLIMSYTYQLPFGKGKQFVNQGKFAEELVGGWQFAGVLTYQGGTPLHVTEGGWDSGIFAGNLGASARPNYVSGQNMNGYHGGGWVWGQSHRLNAAAFTPAPSYTFGDAPRALKVREFASHGEDLSLSKEIPMYTDKVKALFRLEFFNAFNRAGQYTGFDTNTSDGSNLGSATNRQNLPRSIQANLKVLF